MNTQIGRYAELDDAAKQRIESACAFVNEKIRQKRERIKRVAIFSVVGGVIWWLAVGGDPRLQLSVAFLLVIGTLAHAQRDVKKWHKQLVIRRVVAALGEGLSYSPSSTLTKSEFRNLDLFRDRIDTFKSEDQVTGRRNNVAFMLHEVRASREERRGKHTTTVVVFHGLVVVLEFNKNFMGRTIVVPDKEGQRLGGLFGEVEARRGKQIVRLPNTDFENVYTVYSDNDQEAHYLLTPKLQELVLDARRRLGDLRLAFHENHLHVTVPSHHDRFEVSMMRNVTPFDVIADLADVIALAEKLIDVLDLETRIWTRV